MTGRRHHDQGQEHARILPRDLEDVSPGDLHDPRLDQAGRHDEQSENHHDRIAAEAGEGLVDRQQARGDHRQHHTERNDVCRHPIPRKQQDRAAEDAQA